jgi:hypothetical protein
MLPALSPADESGDDTELAKQDLVRGLLKMRVLPRLRYYYFLQFLPHIVIVMQLYTRSGTN